MKVKLVRVLVCGVMVATFPVTAVAQTPAPAAPAAVVPYTLDTPIETLVADPAAKAVLDRDFPSLTSHPAFDSFKALSLKDLQPLSGGALSDAALAKTAADLRALPVPKRP